mgnify:CR=1 FL=1
MSHNIFYDAKIVNSYVSAESMVAGHRTVFDTDRDYKQWTLRSNVNCYGVWNNMLFGTVVVPSSGTAYFGTTGFSPVPAARADSIRIRMKIEVGDDVHTPPIAEGKIQWTVLNDPNFDDGKSTTFTTYLDDEWHVYTISLADHEFWVGDIVSLRIHPASSVSTTNNGFNFFVNYIEVGSGNFTFDVSNFGGDADSGTQGYTVSTGSGPNYTIIGNSNDILVVNIDGFGDVKVKLVPGVDISGREIARDLETKLGSIDIGGYSEVKVFYDGTKFFIYSGTRAEDSNVEVKWSLNSAAYTLGFTDGVGNSIATRVYGTNPALNYVPYANYRLRTLDINRLFDGNSFQTASILNPGRYACEAGRADFAFVTKGVAKDFTGKTVIDIDHPVTAAGKLTTFRMSGVVGRVGDDYGGKFKVFRPKLDGSLTLIYEKDIGIRVLGSKYTKSPDSFKETISVDVRRGDLIGVYNCKLFIGGSPSRDRSPDAMYFIVDGNQTADFNPGELSGTGTMGLSIYAHSDKRQDIAVLDIDLGKRYNIDRLVTKGANAATEVEYNLMAGSDVAITVETYNYQHTHKIEENGVYGAVLHDNIGYNLHALTDGIHWAENGVTSFQEDNAEATYFYISGDGEFTNYVEGGFGEFATSASTSASVPLDDYKSQPYSITFDFTGIGKKKYIDRAIFYFKEPNSSFNFWWEYHLGFTTTSYNSSLRGGNGIPITDGNGETDYTEAQRWQLIPEYTSVFLDDKLAGLTVLYENPTYAGLRFAEDGVTAIDYSDYIAYGTSRHNKIEWQFDPIYTGKIKYTCSYHENTKITEVDIFSSTAINTSPYGSVTVYFSGDGEAFALASDYNGSDGETVYHEVGYNARYLRLILIPFSTLTLNDVNAELNTSKFRFGLDNKQTEVTPTETPRGAIGSTEVLYITNPTSDTLNLAVSIGNEGASNSVVYYNTCTSSGAYFNPDLGAPPLKYYFDPDKDFEINDINLNNPCWGLNNLMLGKYYYLAPASGVVPTGTLAWQVSGTISSTALGYQDNMFSSCTDVIFAVDLGQSYRLDSDLKVKAYVTEQYHLTWPTTSIYFSNTSTSDISSVLWNSTYEDARWIAISVPSGDGKYLDYVSSFPDITYTTHSGNPNTEWTDLGTNLSDSINSTYVNSSNFPIVACQLMTSHSIDYIGFTKRGAGADIGWSVLPANANITVYSGIESDPQVIVWPAFGVQPSTPIGMYNWVVVKNTNLNQNLSKIRIIPEEPQSLFSFPLAFSTEAVALENISTLNASETVYEDVLFGSSGDSVVSGSVGHPVFAAFDDSLNTYWEADGEAPNKYIWRRFGTVSSLDGETLEVTASGRAVKEFSLTVPNNKASVLDAFKLYKLNVSNDWELVATYTDQAVSFGFTNFCDFYGNASCPTNPADYDWDIAVYNNVHGTVFDCFSGCELEPVNNKSLLNHEQLLINNTMSISGSVSTLSDQDLFTTVYYKLDSPVVTSGIKLVIDSTFNAEDDSSHTVESISLDPTGKYVKVSSFDVYELNTTATSGTATFSESVSTYSGKYSSCLGVVLPSGSVEVFNIVSDDISLGTDPLFSERDYLSFKFYIDDPANIDTSYGFLWFGNDANNCYMWNIANELNAFSAGWNTLKVKFEDAEDTSMPTIVEARYDRTKLYPTCDIRKKACNYFSLSLKGSGPGAEIRLDELKIERNNFDEYAYNNSGVYLTNKEYAVLPIADVSLSRGAVSFFLRPDYNKRGYIYPNDIKSFAYFTISDCDNKMVSFLMQSGKGLKFFVNDGEQQRHFIAKNANLVKDEVVHLAVSWDSTGLVLDGKGSTVKVFMNGSEVYSSTTTWNATTNKGLTFFIGGTAPLYSLYTYSSFESGAATLTFVESLASVGGVIQNFTIYNYPKQTFEDYFQSFDLTKSKILTAADMVEISINNIDFYKVRSAFLPLHVEDVSAGEQVPIYIRTNLPKELTGSESRTAKLVVQWEIPIT